MLEWLVQSNYSNNQTIKHEKPYKLINLSTNSKTNE